MKRLLLIALPAGIGVCVTVWGIAVQLHAQVEDEVNWWPYGWLWILAIAAALMAGAFVTLLLTDGRRSPVRRGPDFVLRSRGGAMWEIERVRDTPALEIVQGDGIVSASNISGMFGNPLGDMRKGERRLIGSPNDTGFYAPFKWIEGDGRYYAKSAYLLPGGADLEITGIRVEPGEPIQT